MNNIFMMCIYILSPQKASKKFFIALKVRLIMIHTVHYLITLILLNIVIGTET